MKFYLEKFLSIHFDHIKINTWATAALMSMPSTDTSI